jgi:uncharacterized protein
LFLAGPAHPHQKRKDVVKLSFLTLSIRITTFSTIFLGIFIEALPYLLMGILASGIVEVFIDKDRFIAILPKNRVMGVLIGSLLGLVFPVCECGVVPFARRLFKKGLPLPMGIAFLLAAPIISPIVIMSTLKAFGLGPIFYGRMVLGFGVAVITGLVFSLQTSSEVLLPFNDLPCCDSHDQMDNMEVSIRSKMTRAAMIAGEEFFEMGVYLILGAFLAALMQTIIPQNILLFLGGGPALSILLMIALGVLLSICSTVDSFVALSFAASFSTGSLLAFLVYGAMIDIKALFLYSRVFKKRSIVYLALIPLFLVVLVSLFINYRLGI